MVPRGAVGPRPPTPAPRPHAVLFFVCVRVVFLYSPSHDSLRLVSGSLWTALWERGGWVVGCTVVWGMWGCGMPMHPSASMGCWAGTLGLWVLVCPLIICPGRVALINYGPNEGKLVTIVDVVDGNRVCVGTARFPRSFFFFGLGGCVFHRVLRSPVGAP